MGYRIGFQCFDNTDTATDYQMSMVLPIITQDGKLLQPVKQNEKWYFQGQEVKLSFGHCDPKADYLEGVQFASYLIAGCAAAWFIRQLLKLFDVKLFNKE